MELRKYGMTVTVDRADLICSVCKVPFTDSESFVSAGFRTYNHEGCDPLTILMKSEISDALDAALARG